MYAALIVETSGHTIRHLLRAYLLKRLANRFRRPDAIGSNCRFGEQFTDETVPDLLSFVSFAESPNTSDPSYQLARIYCPAVLCPRDTFGFVEKTVSLRPDIGARFFARDLPFWRILFVVTTLIG